MADRFTDSMRLALIERRGSLSMSQREVAEKMGTTQSAVSEFERGISVPRIDTLRRWASALDLDLSLNISAVGQAASATEMSSSEADRA